MKTQALSLLKEERFSKFGADFLIKNGQVFLIKKYGPITYHTLVENDPVFFKKLLKIWEKAEYSSPEIPFLPTEKDWEWVKNNTHSIILHCTTKCNSDCNICYAKDSLPYEEISINEIKQILSRIGKNKRIILSGGEPTVRKDLFKIISLIKKSGNIPVTYTNGLKLADPNYVKKLKKSGLERVHFSFDGFREEIYEQLRGSSEHLYLKLKALKNLEKFNIEVYISSTIAAGINEGEVGKLLEFCVRNNHFIKGLVFFHAQPFGRFNINTKKLLTASDIIKLLEDASKGTINREYFIEFKKFSIHLYHLLNKIGKFFPYGHGYFAAVPFKTDGNGISQLIPLKELKIINKKLEQKKISIIRHLSWKRLWWLSKFFLSKKFKPKMLSDKILLVNIGYVGTPITYIPTKSQCEAIQKHKGKIFMYVNAG
jgi:uncharacterized radical SAM superfamily Fe-S cluster-containing enzyme